MAPMSPFSDDDEPLIGPSLRNEHEEHEDEEREQHHHHHQQQHQQQDYEATNNKLSAGICTNRIVLLLVLAIMAGSGIYFQSELTELDSQLGHDEEQISILQDIIHGHEQVIQRFNNSVTNTDVLNHLHDLEKVMKTNQYDLEKELDTVRLNIDSQLRSTLNELNQTVAIAENVIHDEVEKVKKDVESYVRTTQDQFSMENSFMVYQLAGTVTLLSCLISMWHMTAHLRKFNQPIVQRKILAILWMCPIYAVTSWVSLVFHQAEGYMAIIKDFYEAYIIYQFLSFCIAVLGGGDRQAVVALLTKHADHLSPPFRFDALCNKNPYENHYDLANAVLLQCQSFAMQFVFLRPLTTIAAFVLDKLQYYGPTGNPMDYRSPQVYIVGLQNISIFVAFAGLLKFYHAVDEELKWCRPFAKFLCIKGVVFMTFWQGLAITILASSTDVGGSDATEWARSAQNFLVCLEMLLFSIAHFYCFPTDEWEDGYRASHEKGRFGDTIALGDFFQDLKLILKSSPKKKKKKKKNVDDDSMTTLEEGDEDGDDEEDDDASTRSALTENDGDDYDEERAMKDIQNAIRDADGDTNAQMGDLVERMLEQSNSWEPSLPPQPASGPPPPPPDSDSSVDGDETKLRMGQYSRGEDEETAVSPSATLNEEELATPTERTSLLGTSSNSTDAGASSSGSIESVEAIRTQNEEMLRPSIFTTVSNLARTSPFK